MAELLPVSGEKSFNPRICSGQTLENFVQIMSNMNLHKLKRIDEAFPQNMKCGYSLELGHVNEDNFIMHDLYQLLDKLNPTERVIDVRMSGCPVITIRGMCREI